jgi:SpoVK/Ycf46/Vps4 family AAA+-type ATPase
MPRGDLIKEMLGREAPETKPRRVTRRTRMEALEPNRLRALPRARGELDLISVRDPVITFDDLLLAEDKRQLFAEVHLELREEDLLIQSGIAPRRTFLFVGPPGCGKSATAEALADELGRELAVVNLATVVSSFLGDTSKNLSSIFEAAASEHWVLLFDEFDAIGKERAERTDHGELKRVVTAFLQQLDNFRGPSVLIAATNHPQLLDLAVWRRFDEVLKFEPPGVQEIRALLRLKLRSIPKQRSFDIERLASACSGMTQADVTRVVHDAYRHNVLHNRGKPLALKELMTAAEHVRERASLPDA